MRSYLVPLLPFALVLTACQNTDDGDADAVETAEPMGRYDIDPASGEVRATHTDAAGVTTTMRAGDRVDPRYPEPFTIYPGAQVTNTTLVDQGRGTAVTVEFATVDARDDVIQFYREQAREADIEPDIEVAAGPTTTLGGTSKDGEMRFALQVTQMSPLTEGQLSVRHRLD